ncbi:MAG: non-canonical purine NTP pyrophosphatase [Chloroflexota bacterium]
MPTILLATGNRAKQAKLRWLIDGLGFEVVTPADIGVSFDPPEHGETHSEVAAAKALAWADHTGRLVIASDGGAYIPVLRESWNSIFTKRAAGAVDSDHARADHLLNLMRPYSGDDRQISWIEGVAVARPGEPLGQWQGSGAIGRLVEQYDPSQIKDGFWFPALVLVPRFGKLVADLTPEETAQLDDGWNALYPDVRRFLATLV